METQRGYRRQGDSGQQRNGSLSRGTFITGVGYRTLGQDGGTSQLAGSPISGGRLEVAEIGQGSETKANLMMGLMTGSRKPLNILLS